MQKVFSPSMGCWNRSDNRSGKSDGTAHGTAHGTASFAKRSRERPRHVS